jgi:ribonuclease BN (tRNA processing enzyme)
MPVHFTVLASGSAGNASLLIANGFGLLLDAGLGQRLLTHRLSAAGYTWNQVHAVILTHTHSDHRKNTTFRYLWHRRTPLYCHVDHHPDLHAYGRAFAKLQEARLVRGYESGQELSLAPGLSCRPVPLRHDGGATFGFRFEMARELFGQSCSLGYLADLGSWNAELVRALTDVDVLALEFNHDVELEYASGRSPYLIARVLGDEGHLSNTQAAGLLREVLRYSVPRRLRHVVQLHLSRECNHPHLAAEAARPILAGFEWPIEVHTTWQDRPMPTLILGPRRDSEIVYAIPSQPETVIQLMLPGMEDEQPAANL